MEDKFKIELNQNLWGLIVSLVSLGLGEYYDLDSLNSFGWWLSLFFSFSAIISLIFYTMKYCKNKMKP